MKEIIVTSSVLILCIMLIRIIFKGKISSRLQYALWLLVALRLIIPVTARIYMAIGSVEEFRVMDLARMMETKVGDVTERLEQPITFTMSVGGPAGKMAAEYVLGQNDDSLNVGDGPTSVFYAGKIGITWLDALRGIWIGGMVVMALWMTVTNIAFMRRLHKGRREFVLPGLNDESMSKDIDSPSTDVNVSEQPEDNEWSNAVRKAKIYTIDDLASPCLYGMPFREAVYLTPDIAESEDRLRHVLIHEMCHRKHGDGFWSLVRSILLIVYWINPFVWVAAVLSKRDCELACDEEALLVLDDEERISYGETLLSIITRKGKLSDIACTATTMTGSSKSVKERIKFIAEKPHVLHITVAAVLILAVAVSVLVFTKSPLFHGDTWEGEITLTADDMQITLPETIAGISGYDTDKNGDIVIYHIASGEEVGRFCEVSYGEAVILVEQGRRVFPIGDYGRNPYLKEYLISLFPNETTNHYYTPRESTTHNYDAPAGSFGDSGMLYHEEYYDNIDESNESYSEGVPGTDSNNDDTTYIIEDESIDPSFTVENGEPVFDEDGNILGYSYSPYNNTHWYIPSPESAEWEVVPLSEEGFQGNMAHEDIYNGEVPGTDSNDDDTTYIIEDDGASTTPTIREEIYYPTEETDGGEPADYLPNEEIIVTYAPADTTTKCYIYVKGDYSGIKTQYLDEIDYINNELQAVVNRVVVVESD